VRGDPHARFYGEGVIAISSPYPTHTLKQQLYGQATLPGLEAQDILPIKTQTLEYGAKLVREAGTGWDYNAIREQFTLQLQQGFRPRNVNAAFIGFVKKKVARRA
jgi:hypothetical protein